jgi:hypothetical protein
LRKRWKITESSILFNHIVSKRSALQRAKMLLAMNVNARAWELTTALATMAAGLKYRRLLLRGGGIGNLRVD